MEDIIYSYEQYEFKEKPIYFLKLSLSKKEKISILSQIDIWYGDTDQSTEVYALEFSIIVRMILGDNAIILNPYHLKLKDVIEELEPLLPKMERERYMKQFYKIKIEKTH